MRVLITCVIVLATAAPTVAEDVFTSPYRNQTSTAIRGLTAKEVSEPREGRGMGVARAAELNGYPGPRHVLDALRDGRLLETRCVLTAQQIHAGSSTPAHEPKERH